MLVGNNIALVAFTSLITVPITAFLAAYTGVSGELTLLLVNTLIITIIVLIFGEYLPKTLFRLYADDALYTLAYPHTWPPMVAVPTQYDHDRGQ